MHLRRHYATVCQVEDVSAPELVALREEVAPGFTPEHRKGWEYAMTAGFLADTGHLGGDHAVLDVGAGHEPLLYWLAARSARTVALDTYGRGAFAAGEARDDMLDDPGRFAPYPYPADRLEVVDADARELPFADAEFDAVVSLSSIEHFGGPAGIRRSAAEIGRVLKPGGHAFLITELVVGSRPDPRCWVAAAVRVATAGRLLPFASLSRAPVEAFDEGQLHELLLAPSGLELMQPLALDVSEATRRDPLRRRRGGIYGPGPPHVLLEAFGTQWTSLALPLRKPA